MFVSERQDSRGFFVDVWHKHKHGEALEPMERLVESVILEHPEYHAVLSSDDLLQRDFPVADEESNPFLHMGMHIAIREQLGSNRPAGIVGVYQELMATIQDAHTLEHQMMECLGEALWVAQRSGTMPDEQNYLECVKKLRR